jgi:hypothetical protein
MKQRKHSNPEYAKAMAELRRSGAAGIHQDKRDKRSRTRNAKLKKALREEDENGRNESN